MSAFREAFDARDAKENRSCATIDGERVIEGRDRCGSGAATSLR